MEIDNLCTQADLNEDTLVETLATRYESGQIYTHSGLLLLSINPYTELDLYSPAVAEMYRRRVENLQPHIFLLIDSCLDAAPVFGPHSVVISGESGSGKTETARRMLAYLGVPMVASVETVLEALGNAWTVKNDNSSRFGKLICLNRVISVEAFLLEKSRVTSSAGERNFHIFYYILASKDETLVNDYIDSSLHSDAQLRALHKQEYLKTKHAFSALQIDFGPVERVLWGILRLGSVRITGNAIEMNGALDAAAECLGLAREELEDYLLRRTMLIRDERIVREHTEEEAKTLRDSIARLLYEGLFGVIAADINRFLSGNPIAVHNINILDIFGFEDMPENGLEQFCINWCNERIYDEFVRGTFEHQKSILASEGIADGGPGSSLGEIQDSCQMRASCIGMIEKKCGLVDLIAEESFINGTAESLGLKIGRILAEKIRPRDVLEINHFAGTVSYQLRDFIGKNKEKGGLHDLYREVTDGSTRPPIILRIVEHECASTSVVKSFRSNLGSLFSRLAATTIKYVKCVKPNGSKAPLLFDRELVKRQLRANGILQSVELSRLLYPYSMFIDDFDERYGNFTDDMVQVVRGNTRCFFNNRTFNILELARTNLGLRQSEIVREACRRCVGLIRDEALARENQMRKERINFESLESLMVTEAGEEGTVDAEPAVIMEHVAGPAEAGPENTMAEFDNAALELLCGQLGELPEPHLSEGSEGSEDGRPAPDPDAEQAPKRHEPGELTGHCVDPHLDCKLTIKRLQDELEKYKQFSVSCSNCQILNQKYKIQSQQLLAKQFVEMELERVKQRMRAYEDSDNSSVESASAYNIFGCLVQLYLDYCPVYSSKDIPRDEMLSLAHAIHFILGVFPSRSLQDNLAICLDEVNRRLADFEENISMVAFVLSNLAELRIILGPSVAGQHAGIHDLSALDEIVGMLFCHLCSMQRASLDDLLPAAILDYQHLKEFRVRESIYKKIFAGPSVVKLTDHLNYFYSLNAYFCLPDVAIINNLSYLLSYMDYVSFNSLLAKRKFLNTNRCIQINYNLSEIEKFCFNVSFHHGFYNMAYMREAARLAMALSGESCSAAGPKKDGASETHCRNISENSFTTFDNHGNACSFAVTSNENISELIENSLLNLAQINTIIELFEDAPLKVSGDAKSLKKFIDEPKPVVPGLADLTTQSKFVKPKYLPDKSLKSIFRTLRQH